MTQTLILEKLNLFVEFEERKQISIIMKEIVTLTEAKIEPGKIQQLKTLSNKMTSHFDWLKDTLEGGKCFGFSLSHGLADVADNLEQWEALLRIIIDYNYSPDTLDHEVEEKFSGFPKKITYRYILELVLNTILNNHGALDESPFSVLGLDQYNMLAHAQLNSKDGIKTIQHYHKIAGNFTEEQLKTLLDEKKIKGNVCLVHSGDHTIRIAYKDSQWMLYNSNNKHLGRKTLLPMSDKNELIKTIFSTLGSSICLENATFDENRDVEFSGYNIMPRLQLISGTGLHVIAENTPEALKEIMESKINRSDIQKTLATSLKMKNVNDETGLYSISHYAPKFLEKIFDLVDDSEEGQSLKESILSSLLYKSSKYGSVALTAMYRYCPSIIPHLFELGFNSRESHLASAYKLFNMIDNNNTGLEWIARHAPKSLAILFQLAKQPAQESVLRAAIIKSLKKRGVEVISKYAPDALADAFGFLKLTDYQTKPTSTPVKLVKEEILAKKRHLFSHS